MQQPRLRLAVRTLRRFVSTAATPPQVTLPWGGRLTGCVVDPENGAPPFQSFLGIPYAAPPVGKLRFMPPQPAEQWSGERAASQERDVCMQIDHYSSKVVGGEDCLYVNVHRPPTTRPDDKKPVLVYVHWGLWSLSNNSMTECGPEFFVAKDMIVVTVNYRVLSFGFLTLNSPAAPGNMGIRDCFAGLRWVHDNITAFGGDPNRVTLFGFCVGAIISQLAQYSDRCKGLFQQSILVSGSMQQSWLGAVPGDVMRARGLKLARLLGCHSDNDEEILTHLQSAPVADLFKATWSCVPQPLSDRNSAPFLPIIDIDAVADPADAIIPENPARMVRGQRSNPVPTLWGLARDDGHIIRGDGMLWEGTRAEEKSLAERFEQLERTLPWDLDLGLPNSRRRQDLIRTIRDLYFHDSSPPTVSEYTNFLSEMNITRGVVEAARRHSTHPQRPRSWLYCFSVEGGNGRTKKRFNLPSGIVAHGDDMGYYFGCRGDPPGPEPRWPPDSIEAVTRRRMVALLSNFVKYGDPTPDHEPEPELRGVRWPLLPDHMAAPFPYLDIGKDLVVREELQGVRMRFWQDVYDRYFTTGDTPAARNPRSFT
ncbi:hypothetical protein ONE63_004999 [Megalurothrips usitatus]|uniref:Carboxylesterase type B domain-containing protein n=1 Tax=Megalurothrips usitatus TaxID=439358 RepID=A0AAV7X5R7_9NEOP|nr:hypothetical protein ONE63_004999 [Megalurothrips usitatus]